MTNQKQGVNVAIGCGVNECKFNKAGEYCSLEKIRVGTNCSCDTETESCTCCESYVRR